MVRATTPAAVVLCGAFTGSQQTTSEPRTFFTKQLGLSDDEVAAIGRGEAVAKVLPSSTPAEVLLFGATHVSAHPGGVRQARARHGSSAEIAGLPGCRAVQRSPRAVEKKWAPATYNRYVEHGRAMFNWAVKRKIVAENPFAHLEHRPEHNQRDKRISPEQERRLFEVSDLMKSKKFRQVGHAMERRLIAALDLGLRAGEMLRLRVKHVDYEHWVVNLPADITKAGRDQRVIVGTVRCKRVLEERRTLGPEAFVFGSEEGRYVASFDKTWKRLFKEAGLPVGRKDGYVWHDLRHEYCSYLADEGASIHEARELMRHADIRTTQRYLKAKDERLRELQKLREKRLA
jgi:site-specific recombinase XerD